jgi:hypothetical protein
MMQDKHVEGIKQSIDEIIGVDTFVKPKRKTEDDIQREKFVRTINLMEQIEVRGMLLANELSIDFSSYDEKFYSIIDTLFELSFGEEASEVIFFYLYERIGPEGTIQELADEAGNIIPLNSPTDLWHVIKQVQEKVKKKKK